MYGKGVTTLPLHVPQMPETLFCAISDSLSFVVVGKSTGSHSGWSVSRC